MRLRTVFALASVAALAACGSVDEPENNGSETSQSQDPTDEKSDGPTTDQSEDPTEDPTDDPTDGPTTDEGSGGGAGQNVEIDLPDGWEEVETEGFEYHYVSTENYWDDILAQKIAGPYPAVNPDMLISVLETNLSESTGFDDITITHRGDTEIDGKRAIVIDAVYGPDSTLSSFTYVDAGDYLWEFTVNAETPEGLAAGEAINESAVFSE